MGDVISFQFPISYFIKKRMVIFQERSDAIQTVFRHTFLHCICSVCEYSTVASRVQFGYTGPMIAYDDFAKVELRTAKVLKAERIEGSEKLLSLEIEMGDEIRPLVAGVGKAYEPGALIGKTIIIVANLEPKTLMGHVSNGMLLAASDGEKPVLLTVMEETPSGLHIR